MFDWLPNDLRSAVDSGIALERKVRSAEAVTEKDTVFSGLVFILGFGVGVACAPVVETALLSALLAVAGALAGFSLTSLLFTGSALSLGQLEYEEAQNVAAKTALLTWSQARAFMLLGLACLPGVVWLLLQAAGWVYVSLLPFACGLFSGFMLIGIYRVALIPFQISELQQYAHAIEIQRKAREINAQARARVSSLNDVSGF